MPLDCLCHTISRDSCGMTSIRIEGSGVSLKFGSCRKGTEPGEGNHFPHRMAPKNVGNTSSEAFYTTHLYAAGEQ